MSTKRINKYIHLLETAFNIKLSKEQLAVIKYDKKTPVTINACAGSGKTTLLEFSIWMKILCFKVAPSTILGITFSRDARLNMQVRFRSIKRKLERMGVYIPNGTPHFSTFHALFYHLLRHFRKYKHVSVIAGYQAIMGTLERALKYPSKALTKQEQLKQIFSFFSQMINAGATYDGINIFKGKDKLVPGGLLMKDHQINPHTVDYDANGKPMNAIDHITYDYVNVIKTYQVTKHKKHKIDFADMKILVDQALDIPKARLKIQKLMGKYQLCYIDEFQDIDGMQWHIMKNILSKTALHTVTVVGDDDQSIYSFRGSNLNIIMNFTKDMPKAKLFHLSINYRTNDKVLAGVKPLIQDNEYRINKKLRSGNHGQRGGLFIIKSSMGKNNCGLVLLESVYDLLKHSPSDFNDVAILVRFNSDRLIALDYFANHNIYVTNRMYMQDDVVYKLFFNIIYALYHNNITHIIPCLQKIGFTKYRHHLLKLYKKDKPKTLMDLVKDGLQHSTGKKNFHVHLLDLQIKNDIRDIKNRPSALHALDLAHDLTQNYFLMMKKYKFGSISNVKDIYHWLRIETNHYDSVNSWLIHEVHKYLKAKKVQDQYHHWNKVHILTIHQSKGLEYKYVFLFNLTDRGLSTQFVVINEHFPPQTDRKLFLHKIINLSNNDMAALDGPMMDTDTSYTGLNTMLMHTTANIMHRRKSETARQHDLTRFAHELINDTLVKHAKQNEITGYAKIQGTFDSMYVMSIHTSKFVEEERRLIYVGVTRAKKCTIANLPFNANPLLRELVVKRPNVLFLNKKKQLVSAVKTPQDDLKQVQHQLKRLSKKYKDLEHKAKEIKHEIRKQHK